MENLGIFSSIFNMKCIVKAAKIEVVAEQWYNVV